MQKSFPNTTRSIGVCPGRAWAAWGAGEENRRPGSWSDNQQSLNLFRFSPVRWSQANGETNTSSSGKNHQSLIYKYEGLFYWSSDMGDHWNYNFHFTATLYELYKLRENVSEGTKTWQKISSWGRNGTSTLLKCPFSSRILADLHPANNNGHPLLKMSIP